MLVWDAATLSVLSVIGFVYGSRSFAIATWRRVAFFAALGLAVILLVGPLAHAALTDFQLHMVQHIGLMMLVAPGLVLGTPGALLMQEYPAVMTRWLSSRVAKLLCTPAVGWVLFVATLFATHFSGVASLANTSTFWHQFVLVWFLVAGLVYYYPVLNGNPLPTPTPHAHRIISLLTMMVPETMTGFFLYASTHTIHDVRPGIDAATALHQQQAAGALMWAAAMAIDTCWIALAVRDWLADEVQRAERS